MCDPPHMTKLQMLEQARAAGLEPPRLYALGFPHNNCGGACVRAGQKQWKRLLDTLPDRYAAAEQGEQRLREQLGDVAILRERVRGQSRPLTLAELRRRHQADRGDRRSLQLGSEPTTDRCRISHARPSAHPPTNTQASQT